MRGADLIDDLGRKKPPGFAGLIAQAEAAKGVVRDGLIAEVGRAFEAPKTLADKAKVAFGQLDAVAADLEARKPPNWQAALGVVTATRDVIRDGLNKPFADYIEQQQQSLAIGAALLAGDEARAEAMRQIAQLERQMGPLTAAQKAEVLATVEALDAQARALDVLHGKQELYLGALGDMRGIVEDATQAFVRGDLGQFIKSPKRLLDAFQSLSGKLLFDKLFGETFRKLEDKIRGRDVVTDAGERMATAVDGVTAQSRRTTGAFETLEGAADRAAGALGRTVGGGAGGMVDGAGGMTAGGATGLSAGLASLGMLIAGVGGTATNAGGGSSTDSTTGDIVVTGRKPAAPIGNFDLATVSSLLRQITLGKGAVPRDQSSQQFFSEAIGKVGTKVAGLFTDPEKASQIGRNIGNFAGKGLAGAATGQLVSGISNALGIKMSGTGAQIGGAVGSFIPIPGGQIIGSVLGGLAGNLFAPKAKPGGATVSSVGGVAGVSGSVGSDKAGIAAGNSLGGQVASTVNQIVQQLGGQLGDFSVQIGKYKDDLRVNVNGKALGGVKGSGAVGFKDDENAAVAYAAAQAIAQGAVTGVSDAVAKALRSSTDVDKALREALKVQELELAIGGIGAQMRKAFKDFEATAKERVRIAGAYGFDVLAIEKKNADDRLALANQLVQAQVGSLRDLLGELTTGDLFEGDAATRRKAIQGQIAQVQADAEAGKEGAADKLAALERQLVQTSREAFGTAGDEYAADRSSALSSIQRVIDAAQKRVDAAAGPGGAEAVAASNALLGEQNDLTAVTNAKLDALLAAVTARNGAALGFSTAATARFVELA